jgi:hypothetical protein
MEKSQFTFSFNQKFKVMPSAGRVILTMYWYSQGVLLAHFQKHGENVNSASYCEVLLTLRGTICRQHLGHLARGVLLHHDNARPHTAWAILERIQERQLELLEEHPPYSPDLAPSWLPSVWSAKILPWWQRQQSKDFYAAGFDALIKRWDRCINVGGGYVKK